MWRQQGTITSCLPIFVVTFKVVYGEMKLMSASDASITIFRDGGQYSSTVVQSMTISADKPFAYKVQSIVNRKLMQYIWHLNHRSGGLEIDALIYQARFKILWYLLRLILSTHRYLFIRALTRYCHWRGDYRSSELHRPVHCKWCGELYPSSSSDAIRKGWIECQHIVGSWGAPS